MIKSQIRLNELPELVDMCTGDIRDTCERIEILAEAANDIGLNKTHSNLMTAIDEIKGSVSTIRRLVRKATKGDA